VPVVKKIERKRRKKVEPERLDGDEGVVVYANPRGTIFHEREAFNVGKQAYVKGDVVKVKGETGTFVVLNHTVNTKTDGAWVNLWWVEHEFRSVRPEKIRVIKKPRKRKKKEQ
jgi:hypothetical protein